MSKNPNDVNDPAPLSTQDKIVFDDNRRLQLLLGENNKHLHQLELAFNCVITNRGNEIYLQAPIDNVQAVKQVLYAIWNQLKIQRELDQHDIDTAIRFQLQDGRRATDASVQETKSNVTKDPQSSYHGDIKIVTRKREVRPRNPNQGHYIQAMRDHNIVISLGAAGTGKTYLAVAQAVSMLEQGKIERIVLSRPAVEAGERLGFLPGDLQEKIDPYLRPLYDSLNDLMYLDKMQKKIVNEEIEIAPLAFMRGRTLSNAFIILDEAQNATSTQMKMLLTRLGHNAWMVINGDPSQVDLPKGQVSGLAEAAAILKDVNGIKILEFNEDDVVRSPLVGRIIKAYNKNQPKDNT
jgi:phosphate starvation-inducible PhoH-like protein